MLKRTRVRLLGLAVLASALAVGCQRDKALEPRIEPAQTAEKPAPAPTAPAAVPAKTDPASAPAQTAAPGTETAAPKTAPEHPAEPAE